MAADKNRCYELILNYNCNARCSFCSQGDFDKSRNAPFAAIARGIYAARRAGYTRLGFTGGEPLVRPDILKAIALGRSVGFKYIRVQTNGIKLSDAAFCRRLAEAGLTFCKFSFASDRAAEHDKLVGVPGAFRKALAGLGHLRRLKIRVSVNILVSRRNYRRLPEMISFFLRRGVSGFVVIYPVYTGAMAANAGELGVSLPACEPFFARALKVMEAAGLPGEILFLNVPPCFLKGRESLSIGLESFNTLVTDPDGRRTDLDDSAGAARVKGPPCRRCALAARCGGADERYIELFGWKGFVPAAKKTSAKRSAASKAPAAVPARGRLFFSDNERCFIELLRGAGEVATAEALRRAKKLPLCRDCADGNAVLNAASRLAAKGLVKQRYAGGVYRWSLAVPYARIKKWL